MSWRSVPLPSPAMAVALCALFVALGGASYALTLPRDSVGPKQLRARAVTSTKLGTGAVTARVRTVGTDSQNGWEVYGSDAPHPIDRRLMVVAICLAT